MKHVASRHEGSRKRQWEWKKEDESGLSGGQGNGRIRGHVAQIGKLNKVDLDQKQRRLNQDPKISGPIVIRLDHLEHEQHNKCWSWDNNKCWFGAQMLLSTRGHCQKDIRPCDVVGDKGDSEGDKSLSPVLW